MTTETNQDLLDIPLVDVGPDFAVETVAREPARVQALLDEAAGRVPSLAVRMADAVSKRWLRHFHAGHLAEIERVAEHVGRPGAYFLNVSYEWGCTSSVRPAAGGGGEGRGMRLVRVLDWPDRGLGRHVMAARVESRLGAWVTLTWPGYTGVLQASAPGRFAAALNQGPMERSVGLVACDWCVNRWAVWWSPHLPPAMLLRRVFERAPDYATARRMLTDTPITLPTIFTLAGPEPGEGCVIERRALSAHVIEAPAAAANAWQRADWRGRARGEENGRRRHDLACARGGAPLPGASGFDWLAPPVLNERTRLAMVAEPASGRLWAQGFEACRPATALTSFDGATVEMFPGVVA
ncbi:MAG: hypothetical protein GC150_14645 [Rhizobiales bacterium]|nr:hypothetical protein [Hyphomicrobiales bacterium]